MSSTQTALAQPLAEVVAGLLTADLTVLPDSDVTALLQDVERCTRQLSAVSTRVVVEAGHRAILQERGYRAPYKYLIDSLRLSVPEAQHRITIARKLGTWQLTSGDTAEPNYPHTAAARSDGDISNDHVRHITAILRKIPANVPIPQHEAAEKILAECARTGTPEDVDTVGRHLLAHLDPDGTLTDEHDRRRRRGFTIGAQGSDLMSPIHGELDPVARALLEPLLAKWARPGMNNPDDPDSPTGACTDQDAVAAAATRDTRTAAQRNHDALAAICRSTLESTAAGRHRGLPVTAIITMTLEQLEKASGVATTATGGLVPIKDALRMAEHAHPILVLFDHNGRPMHLGRTQRLADADLRLALIAGDIGCTRPGCDAPATMCAAHHVKEWSDGGETDIENVAFVCDACHALINDSENGWRTIKTDDTDEYPGRTAYLPPTHIDPQRRPRINHRHHPGELLKRALCIVRARERAQLAAWRREHGSTDDGEIP